MWPSWTPLWASISPQCRCPEKRGRLKTLTIGDVDVVPPVTRELPWPDAISQSVLAAALVDTSSAPDGLSVPLRQAQFVGGLTALAEYHVVGDPSAFIFDRRTGNRIPVAADATFGEASEGLIRMIVEWVMTEPVMTRLLVARAVIGDSAAQLLEAPNESLMTDRLTMAYRAATDDQTTRALTALASFEDHVNTVTARVNDLARSIDRTVDDAITRTLAALLAIFVASVISKEVQGWPLFAAATGVAAYVLWTAMFVLAPTSSDVRQQARLLRSAFAARPAELATPGMAAADQMETSITRRILWRQVALAALSVVVLVLGVALWQFAGESSTESSAGVATVTASPSP